MKGTFGTWALIVLGVLVAYAIGNLMGLWGWQPQ